MIRSAPASLKRSASPGAFEWTTMMDEITPVLAISPTDPAAANALADDHHGGNKAAAEWGSRGAADASMTKTPTRAIKAETPTPNR